MPQLSTHHESMFDDYTCDSVWQQQPLFLWYVLCSHSNLFHPAETANGKEKKNVL